MNMKNATKSTTVRMPQVVIDTTSIHQAGKAARKALEESTRLTAAAKLSRYKMKTINNKRLTAEDYLEITPLIYKMNSKNWLTDEDRKWCEVNDIVIL